MTARCELRRVIDSALYELLTQEGTLKSEYLEKFNGELASHEVKSKLTEEKGFLSVGMNCIHLTRIE